MKTFKIASLSMCIGLLYIAYILVDNWGTTEFIISMVHYIIVIFGVFYTLRLIKDFIVELAKSQLNEVTELINDRFKANESIISSARSTILKQVNDYHRIIRDDIETLQKFVIEYGKDNKTLYEYNVKVMLKHMDVNDADIIKQLTNQNLNYKLNNDLLKSFIVDIDNNNNDAATLRDRDLQIYIAKAISKLADAHYITNSLNNIRNEINNNINIAKIKVVNTIQDDHTILENINSDLRDIKSNTSPKPKVKKKLDINTIQDPKDE